MAVTSLQPLFPAGVSIANGTALSFLSNLSIQDRSFLPDLIDIYGNQNYTMLLEMLGMKENVENQSFYHYETRGKLHTATPVAAATSNITAGGPITVTLLSSASNANGGHFNAGTQSPLRVGEVIEIMSSGKQGKITGVNKTTANAHTATIQPLVSTETINVVANDFLLFKGLTDVGESSTKFDNIQNLVKKVTNTTTEIREDYEITDRAAMERIEFAVDGVRYYKRKGTKDAERRFLNNVEDKLIFGVPVSNTTITANGTLGTAGLLSQIASGGSALSSTVNSATTLIAAIQEATRQMDFNGAPAEAHWLSDVYQFQAVQNYLFNTYTSGAVLWGSVGGDSQVAAKYGFKSIAIEGYNIHFKKYAPFSSEWKYGATGTSTATPFYRNFGVLIPVGNHNDPKTGGTNNVISVVTQTIPGIGEVNAYEWGGLAPANKDGQQHVVNTMITYKGLRLRAANQCSSIKFA